MINSYLDTLEKILGSNKKVYIVSTSPLGLDSPIRFGIEEILFFVEQLYTSRSSKDASNLISSFFKYLFNLFLLFSFVHQRTEEGYEIKFLKYLMGKYLYVKIIQEFISLMRESNDLKEFLKNAPSHYLELRFYKNLMKVESLSWFKVNILKWVVIELDKVPKGIEEYLQLRCKDIDNLGNFFNFFQFFFRFKLRYKDIENLENCNYPKNSFTYSTSTNLYKQWLDELAEFLYSNKMI